MQNTTLTTTVTIAELARDWDTEVHEIEAYLDITGDPALDTPLGKWGFTDEDLATLKALADELTNN